MIFFILLTLTAFFVSGVFSDGTDKVTMMEGDSVTLQTGVKTIHLEDIKWYCNSIRIAQINGDQSFICTDVQCNEGTERFRDRLKLDHQTGSLTIMNTRTTDSGLYELKIINNSNISERIFNVTVLGVSAAEKDKMKRKSVTEGESVTLDPGVVKNPNDVMTWYFNDTLIAEISGDQSKICTDVQCKERFRNRLKLDHQTGSLTIMNTRTTDSGLYRLQIVSNTISDKTFNVTVIGTSGADRDVFVMEGDSVTLYTDVKTNQYDRIKWFCNDTRIAQIIGGQSYICSDAECPERFRGRLNLDHQTGSLTIMNINITDAGQYRLQIINGSSSSSSSEKIFSVAVHGVPASERDELKRKSVKEGESVSLDPGIGRKANHLMTWYFNDFRVAEITGDQSKICTDVQCDQRFRGRLKLDQTGSLTIMNTRTTDSGLYKLKIISSTFSIRRRRRRSISITSVKSFNVSVTDSGLSSGAIAGIVLAVVLASAAAVVGTMYYRKNIFTPVLQNDIL